MVTQKRNAVPQGFGMSGKQFELHLSFCPAREGSAYYEVNLMTGYSMNLYSFSLMQRRDEPHLLQMTGSKRHMARCGCTRYSLRGRITT